MGTDIYHCDIESHRVLDKAAAISALAAVLDLLGRPVSPRSGPEPH